jgi:hypothetical protein
MSKLTDPPASRSDEKFRAQRRTPAIKRARTTVKHDWTKLPRRGSVDGFCRCLVKIATRHVLETPDTVA